MKTYLPYLSVPLLAFLLACQASTSQDQETPITVPDEKRLVVADFAEQALLLFEDSIYQGKALIDARLQEWMVSSFEEVGRVYQDSIQYYAYGTYSNAQSTYTSITAWRQKDSVLVREFMVIYDQTDVPQPHLLANQIDTYRAEWVRLSNAHNHENLVQNLYAPRSYYFNNWRLAEGTAAISERYAYMSNPRWQITLHPLWVKAVQPKLVFEVGQYRSSGVGHYIIIWQQQTDDRWQVLLDFNF